jgi:mannose-6-phosphate isomerase
LPFLFKVLAAETPLSIQAHPNPEQAERGFDADEAAGIDVEAPQRNYRDRSHKPELLCALTEFEALCGFRAPRESAALLALLGVSELREVVAALEESPDATGVRRAVSLALAEGVHRPRLVEPVVAACASHARADALFARELSWAARLGELYPGDVGCVLALLLNLLVLRPGEAIFLPAGNLHSYLRGAGVEIMANSDNVLRAGLTPKHVNPSELVRIVDFRAGPVALVEPRPRRASPELVYATPAPEFELSRVDLDGAAWSAASRRGPEILLCTRGTVECKSNEQCLTLTAGGSVFVLDADGVYSIGGTGQVFRAQIGTSA